MWGLGTPSSGSPGRWGRIQARRSHGRGAADAPGMSWAGLWAARAEGDRGAAGSGGKLGAVEGAVALGAGGQSRSLTSIPEPSSPRAAGSEPGAVNGTRAVPFQLCQGQPGLHSFVWLAIME